MTRTRYLPAGSMRRQRRLGRLEGSLGTALLMIAAGAIALAATPPELLIRTAYTVRPAPTGEAPSGTPIELPPCTGAGKDCTESEPATLVPWWPVPHLEPVPLPQLQHHAHPVPEPGTLALVGAGLAAALWRRPWT